MNRFVVVSFLLLGTLPGLARAQESPLASLAWLTGRWAEEGAEAGTVEQWMAHDFPQRVIYQMLSNGKLAARIEGMRNGALRGIDFPMKRTSCAVASVQ